MNAQTTLLQGFDFGLGTVRRWLTPVPPGTQRPDPPNLLPLLLLAAAALAITYLIKRKR